MVSTGRKPQSLSVCKADELQPPEAKAMPVCLSWQLCHTGLLFPWGTAKSQWPLVSMGPCTVTMVVSYWILGSMTPRCVKLASIWGSIVSQWSIASMRPCRVTGVSLVPQYHNGSLVPWELTMSEGSPWFHDALQSPFIQQGLKVS